MTYTHGFDVDTLLILTRRGFASVGREKMRAGDHTMQVSHLRITEEGRRALMPLTTENADRVAANIAKVRAVLRRGS